MQNWKWVTFVRARIYINFLLYWWAKLKQGQDQNLGQERDHDQDQKKTKNKTNTKMG